MQESKALVYSREQISEGKMCVNQKADPIAQYIYYRLECNVTAVSFSEGKAAGAWSYNSKSCPKLKMVYVYI
jgi:hypothetical protein